MMRLGINRVGLSFVPQSTYFLDWERASLLSHYERNLTAHKLENVCQI